MSGSGSLEARVEALLARVEELESVVAQRDRRIAELEAENAELRGRAGDDLGELVASAVVGCAVG